ncbi:unnamed protein product [Amoebophrya sp. A25]|nr:unnamed protein product [Amoebophrya sp. A25]|eukprot:GSA25T00021669001.1
MRFLATSGGRVAGGSQCPFLALFQEGRASSSQGVGGTSTYPVSSGAFSSDHGGSRRAHWMQQTRSMSIPVKRSPARLLSPSTSSTRSKTRQINSSISSPLRVRRTLSSGTTNGNAGAVESGSAARSSTSERLGIFRKKVKSPNESLAVGKAESSTDHTIGRTPSSSSTSPENASSPSTPTLSEILRSSNSIPEPKLVRTSSSQLGPCAPEDQSPDNSAVEITWLGAGCNLLLAGVKGGLGVVTNSSSLIADAVHSLSDLLSDAVTIITIRFVDRPPDKGHPYGYMRYEQVGTLSVSAFICAAGLGIGREALETLIQLARPKLEQSYLFTALSGSVWPPGGNGISQNGAATSDLSADLLTTVDGTSAEASSQAVNTLAMVVRPEDAPLAMVAVLISFGVKEALYRRTLEIGHRKRSPVVIANAWHHRSDAMTSGVAGVGIAGAYLDFPLCDPLGGLLVAVMVFRQGAEMMRESVAALADRDALSDDMRGKLTVVALKASEDVLGVRSVNARKAGNSLFVDLEVTVNPRLTLSGFQHLSQVVKQDIKDKVEDVVEVDCTFDCMAMEPSRGGERTKFSIMTANAEEEHSVVDELAANARSVSPSVSTETSNGSPHSASAAVDRENTRRPGYNMIFSSSPTTAVQNQESSSPDPTILRDPATPFADEIRLRDAAASTVDLQNEVGTTPTTTVSYSVKELTAQLERRVAWHTGAVVQHIDVHFLPPLGSNCVSAEIVIAPGQTQRLGDLKRQAHAIRDFVLQECDHCRVDHSARITQVEVRLDLADGCHLIASRESKLQLKKVPRTNLGQAATVFKAVPAP